MATILSDQYNKPVPGQGCEFVPLYGEYTFTANASDGDVVKMFKIPVGFVPLFGWLMGDDLDTGTEELDMDVGITGDATKFLNGGLITGDTIANEKITVGIKMPLQEDLMLAPAAAFTSETDCILTINTNAAAGGTGTIKVILCGLINDPRI